MGCCSSNTCTGAAIAIAVVVGGGRGVLVVVVAAAVVVLVAAVAVAAVAVFASLGTQFIRQSLRCQLLYILCQSFIKNYWCCRNGRVCRKWRW